MTVWKNWRQNEPLTINDVLEYLGSYITDVETNLQMDEHAWADYLENPGPVLVDLLMDFGTFPEGARFETIQAAVYKLVERYVGGRWRPLFGETTEEPFGKVVNEVREEIFGEALDYEMARVLGAPRECMMDIADGHQRTIALILSRHGLEPFEFDAKLAEHTNDHYAYFSGLQVESLF